MDWIAEQRAFEDAPWNRNVIAVLDLGWANDGCLYETRRKSGPCRLVMGYRAGGRCEQRRQQRRRHKEVIEKMMSHI
jgi:hypothetical protein